MDLENELHMDPSAITSLGDSLTSTEKVNSLQKSKRKRNKKKKKRSTAVEHKDKGPDLSLGDSTPKTDATLKDLLHKSPDLPDLSSSQTVQECNSKKKKRRVKRLKTQHEAVERTVNGCDTPENSFSSKTCTPVFHMPSEHPIQRVSTDSVTSQSCVKADMSQGENEEKEQNMPKKAAESSNGECDVHEVSHNSNSVVADAVSSAKESVFEFVEKNNERNINDNSINPEEKSSVKKRDDDNPGVCDSSDTFQYVYRRRKFTNFNHRGNCDYQSPVNCNKEPAMRDRQENDLHKFSDGPLTVDLVAGEASTSEQNFITISSVGDVPVRQPEETNARQLDHAEITRNDLSCPGDVSALSSVTINDGNSKISQFSLDRTIISYPKKKLLILDVNGLLADLVNHDLRGKNQEPVPDLWIKRKKVYKRPYCEDFLQFCFDRFHVGVWSSRKKSNVDEVIKFLMGESASKLLFCWHQYHCTWTKFTTVEDIHKPLVLKEIRKLWEKKDPALPWEKGAFNESNTLLLDDSPYKALMNPKHTAIFPYTYRYHDTKDSSLGPGGDLRVYLEGLLMAENVQEYVASNPFGQRPIRETNPSWGYYLKVLESVKRRYKN